MKLKPGYTLTEVGVIPEEWEVKGLGECLKERPTYGINAPAVPFSDRLPVYIRITDISEDGRFCPSGKVSVQSELSSNYYLSDGDIVLARTGASVGKSYLYNPDDGPLVYAGFLIRVRPDPQKLLPLFAAALVTTVFYWRWVRLMSMRSGQPGINGNEYSQLPIPLPPLPEQIAIAEALSDVDALLAAIDQLIAKKRNLKQATMQQLLTGATRLPGFRGEWEVRRLGEVLSRLANGAVYQSPYLSGVLMTRIETIANGTIDYSRTGYAAMSAELENYKLVYGDILFSHINSLDHIGKVAQYLGEQELYHGMNLLLLRVSEYADSRFLYYWLTSTQARQKVRSLARQAVNQASINTTELKTLEMLFPPLPEQTAIAEILSEMDAEILALEERRKKTAGIKQGMMQELLTGRVRLV